MSSMRLRAWFSVKLLAPATGAPAGAGLVVLNVAGLVAGIGAIVAPMGAGAAVIGAAGVGAVVCASAGPAPTAATASMAHVNLDIIGYSSF